MASPVFYAPSDDDEMRAANETARATFRFFWRELSWEQRRIVPGLGLAMVKVPFHDPPDTETVEQMWVGHLDFDGSVLVGELLNQPNQLRSVSAGDRIELSVDGISDWMYSIGERVYGGYTVNVIRRQMNDSDRSAHDAAWGLDFGDPATVAVVPETFYTEAEQPSTEALALVEHPMAVNMREKLDEALRDDASLATQVDGHGFTLLQRSALCGDAGAVEVLLSHGANPSQATPNGLTPLALAESLGWPTVIEILRAR